MAHQASYFGTDGVRGQANTGKMTPQSVLALGIAAGRFIQRENGRHQVVIAKDTRLSGYMIEPALVAGFTSVGMHVKLLGPLPTPGLALMTRTLRADLGVMITASHNHFADNGIKFFNSNGQKLGDDDEASIAALMEHSGHPFDIAPEHLGRVQRYDDSQARYIEIVKSTFPRRMRLNGLKIVIDCANGAAYKTAPATLWELGADKVIPIGCHPNGLNINATCGSTDTALLTQTVKQHNAHIGIALDGDADRLILCDEKGQIINGDQILALMAYSWQQQNHLSRPGLVSTILSNLGLERYLMAQKLQLERTHVGDRHVAALMRTKGYNLGGEPSGHMLMTDFSPTGDAMIAALQVLAEIIRQEHPASEVLNQFEPVPQSLKNVHYTTTNPLLDEQVLNLIKAQKQRLGSNGRLIVRPSGTESLIRIMVEGDNQQKINAIATELEQIISHKAA